MGKFSKGDVVKDSEGHIGQVAYELDNGVYCVITIKDRKVMHQYHPDYQLSKINSVDFDSMLREVGYKVDRSNNSNWIVSKL